MSDSDDYTLRYSLLVPMPHYGRRRTLDLELFDLLPKFDPKTDKIFNHWIRFITFTQCFKLTEPITLYCLKKKLLDEDVQKCEKYDLSSVLKILLYLKHKYGTFPKKEDYLKQFENFARRKNENIVSMAERAMYIIKSTHYDKFEPNKSFYMAQAFKKLAKNCVSSETWRFFESMEENYKIISRRELSYVDVIGLINLHERPKDYPNFTKDPIAHDMTVTEANANLIYLADIAIDKYRCYVATKPNILVHKYQD